MTSVSRPKVFLSYHHEEDQLYKDHFLQFMKDDVVDRSVGDGDIDSDDLKIETTRQYIRDDFIAGATVTIVLIGRCTWRRKFVDWEIGSSLRDTDKNPRCGLLGMLLPSHPDYGKPNPQVNRHLLPPRFADNWGQPTNYAQLYRWPEVWNRESREWRQLQAKKPAEQKIRNGFEIEGIRKWIDRAFQDRLKILPVNNQLQFKNNRSGPCAAGWQS